MIMSRRGSPTPNLRENTPLEVGQRECLAQTSSGPSDTERDNIPVSDSRMLELLEMYRGGTPRSRAEEVPAFHDGSAMAHLGTGGHMLIAFSLLNATLGFLFGSMFTSRSITFAITAVHNGWNVDEKASACHRAAVGWLLVAACVVINAVLTSRFSAQLRGGQTFVFGLCCFAKNKVRRECRRFVPKERLTVLGYSKKGSDESEESEELTDRRGSNEHRPLL